MSGTTKANNESWSVAHEASQQIVLQAAMEDVEKQAVKLEDDLVIALKENVKQSNELKTMQLKIDELEVSLRSESMKLGAVQKDYQQCASALESARLSEKEKDARFDRLQRESDALRDEIGRLHTENRDYKSNLNETEAQVKLDNTEIVPLRYEVQRLTTEMGSLSSHSAWLEQELKSKTDHLLSLRSSHAQVVEKLQRQLDEASGENEKQSRNSASLRQRLQVAQSKIDDTEKELQKVRQEASNKALESEQSAAASKKLVAIQKQKIDRLNNKYDSVCRQLDGLKRFATDGQQQGNSDLHEREEELQSKMDAMLEEQAKSFAKQLTDSKGQLEQARRRCEQAENSLLLGDAASSTKKRKAIDKNTVEHLSLTDLYSRIASTEDELRKESLLRKQAEIRVTRIEADIRAKAPELLRQRKEYEVAVERQLEYKNRLQSALEEAEESRLRYSELEAEVRGLQSQNKDLELDSIELAKQVQSLLAARTAIDGGVDSIPASVIEMQSTNQRLLSEHRQLTVKVMDLEQEIRQNPWQEKAARLEKEVHELIDDRKRQEVMVEQIVEQRDLFRALVKNQDSASPEEASLAILHKHGERSKELEESKQKIEEKLEIATKKLDSSKQDSLAMLERLSRYEALNEDLSNTVDKLQSQLSTAMANAAKSSADSAYHKSKMMRTENTSLRLREEISEITAAKNKLQLINHSLQDALSKANSECALIESELEQTKVKLRVAESQTETARKAEERASNEAKQLRMELTSQVSLGNSIQRIETTLAARNTGIEESYKSELRIVSKKLSDREEEHASELRRLKEEVNDQGIRLMSAEDTRKEAAKEALQANRKLLETIAVNKQLEELIQSLKSDLIEAQEKLGPADSRNPVNELRMQVESLTEKYKIAKEENESLKKIVVELKEVSKGSEDAVLEMTNALKIASTARSDELSTLDDQLTVANAELEKMKQVVADLTRDLSSQREQREKAVQDGKSKLIEAESRIAKLRSDAENAHLQCKELESEVAQLRLDASISQKNYERELNLHSQARTHLRTAREEAENHRRARSMAEIKLQNLGIELSEEKAIVAREKADLEVRVKDQEKVLEEARTQNVILHEQLEKIGDQIQNIKGDAMSANNNFLSSSTDVELQKTISELREVIKFLRSEKEVIQVQLDAARREAERDRAAAEVARQSLDHVRIEMRQSEEFTGSIDENSLKSKLDDSESRCQLLEESNAHLREEIKACQQKIMTLSADLEALKQASIPIQMNQRDLEARNAGLDAERESLRREVDDWKGRVQALVTQFNQIDPIEHQKVVKELGKMRTELDDLVRKKVEAEDESKRIRQLAGRASKELQQNKQLVEKQKRMISELTEEKDNMAELYKGNKLKDLEELKKKISELEEERNNGKKLLFGANEMNEKLRERLRQFQKVINDCKKKEALLHGQLEQARAQERDSDEAKVDTQPKLIAHSVPHARIAGEMHEKDPTDKPETKDRVDGAAVPKTKKVITNVPLGGFVFGPSEPDGSTLQDKTNDDSSMPNNVSLEDNNSEVNASMAADGIKRKNALEKSLQLSKDDGKSSPKADSEKPSPITREFLGEQKELSMKEKLMERKRKLMIDMQMKQEALRKTQDVVHIATRRDEPSAKRTKVADEANHLSETSVKPKAIDVSGASVAGPSFNSANESQKQSLIVNDRVDSTTDDRGHFVPATNVVLNFPDSGESLQVSASSVGPGDQPVAHSNQREASFAGAFLDIKPPGVSSSAPKFQFGSSNAIKLPTPSVLQQSNVFNAFSTATAFSNGGVSIKPLFVATGGGDDNKKRGTDEKAVVARDEKVSQNQKEEG
ncbi:unnamed protein product [Cylindrotheca closterium]|uniref:Nucleoprotein TPR/MLP1 domain-containing protein n=1 Tax=Cylindrotheca closterium TaxID=2856 RepID=A0AAD2FS38_9STRA|nr:unnamed protein product [Cylindrotheca closterium]